MYRVVGILSSYRTIGCCEIFHEQRNIATEIEKKYPALTPKCIVHKLFFFYNFVSDRGQATRLPNVLFSPLFRAVIARETCRNEGISGRKWKRRGYDARQDGENRREENGRRRSRL